MDICQRIRRGGVTTPILMLTGHDDVADRVTAKFTRVSPEEALIGFVLRVRGDTLMERAVQRMAAEHMAIPRDSNVARLMSSMMTGTHLFRNELGELESVYTAAEANVAIDMLRRLGLKPGESDIEAMRRQSPRS